MAINEATLTKEINGVREYIYPKTKTSLVKDGNSTLDVTLESIKNMTTVSSLSEMTVTTSLYIYNNRIYAYDTNSNSWTAKGTLPPFPSTESSLTTEGAYADSKATGDRLSALETKVGSNNVTTTIESYITTSISATGTKVPTAKTVKDVTDGLNTRTTTLEGYVGGQNVTNTIEGYIVSNIVTAGTKVPTASAVKSGIEGYIVTDINTTGTRVPTCATVKDLIDALSTRATTIEGYIGGKNVSTTVEDYIVTNLGTTGTKVPTCATVKSVTDALSTSKADKATTLSGYGITNAYTKSEVDAKITSVYKPKGSIAPSGLTEDLLVESNEGFVYNINASFTTTANFVEGTGLTFPAGSNVAVVNTGSNATPIYKFDVLSGMIDLSTYTTFSDVEGYIVTNIATTGTKVPTCATVKDLTDSLASRATTLENYVGGKNVTTTVEGYIVTDITTAGTKVPTASAVKSGIESYIVTDINTTGTKVPTAATVKSAISGAITTTLTSANAGKAADASAVNTRFSTIEGYVGGQNVTTTVEGYIVSDITTAGTKVPTAAAVKSGIESYIVTNIATTGTKVPTCATVKAVTDALSTRATTLEGYVGNKSVASTVEGYIVTDISTTGTKVPTAATVKAVTDALATRATTLEGYVGGKNVTTTVEDYIVSNITTTGTKVPTAAAVKSGIEGYIVTDIATTGTKVPTAATVKAVTDALSTRATTLEGYVGGKNVTTTVEGYIVTNITTTGTKVPTAAAVKSGIEGYIVTDISTTGTKVPTAATVKSVTDALATRATTLEGYVGGKTVASTVEGYIVTDISTTGTKVPTAATVKSYVDSHVVESTATTYNGHIYTILDASNNILAYFDTNGGFHINGPIYATNI